jgi:hypothetical protein
VKTTSDLPALVVSPALFDALVDRVAERLARCSEPTIEPWVGVTEAARHLGCKPQRIYDLVSRRAVSGIPHRKEGGRLLFRLSQLDRWLDSGAA